MEVNGQPWFVGKDVAEVLGYLNPSVAIAKKVDSEDKGISILETPGGKQKTTIINESGMYSLIMSSKLPTAKQFKRWVTSEVLPSVRKNGGYIAGQEALTETELMDKALLVAQRILEEPRESVRRIVGK